jgi:hypothetical protein
MYEESCPESRQENSQEELTKANKSTASLLRQLRRRKKKAD